jgi:outer membrane protein OmpU
MKHVLLATTALAMTASLAAAEVSLSGRAGAGVLSNGTDSEVWSGMDIAISASVTTDGGMTLSVGDDIGGGEIADYADKELDSQAGDIGTPGVTIAMGGTSVSVDNQAIDDLYDDDQNGDIGVSTSIGGLSIGLTYDTDPAVHGGEGANAAIMNAGSSYSLSGAMGAISVGVVGTDRNDAGKSAYKVSASFSAMPGATVSASADMVDGDDAVTEFGIAYAMGDVSVSYSADNQEDWDASVSYSAGNMTVSYATDEEDAYEIDASVAMGGGVSLNAAADSNDTMILGVGFTL